MKPTLTIRARLALVSAVLSAFVLALGLMTVYLIEAHQVHQTLVAEARTAAHDLAVVGEHRESDGVDRQSSSGGQRSTSTSHPPGSSMRPPTVVVPPPVTGEDTADGGEAGKTGDGVQSRSSTLGAADAAFVAGGRSRSSSGFESAGEEDALASYLGARRGSSDLLVYLPPHGQMLANRVLALQLAKQHPILQEGGVRAVSVGGQRYVVTAAARGRGVVLAGVPVAEADAAVRRLLDAMLLVCLIGLIPVTVGAWLVARRALSPLSRIAQRASRVTAGDLSVRVGPVSTRDEIGEVATAIDAMLDRLEAAFSAQRRFVHDASHELRTPLTIARGHLEVALPQGGSEVLRQAVGVAIAELDRMGALVDSLLRLARAGEGDGGGWPTMDVAALAAAAIYRCRVLGDRDWQLAAENGAQVCGDGAALEQVVVNLLSNAVRHTSAGDSIAVQVEPVGDRVEVRVIDSGEGIDPELRSSLFDRFTRADSARSRDTGGAGLGLAICHAIVTAHGGTIAARDTPSGGATFVVSLPQAGARPRDGEIRVVSPPAHA